MTSEDWAPYILERQSAETIEGFPHNPATPMDTLNNNHRRAAELVGDKDPRVERMDTSLRFANSLEAAAIQKEQRLKQPYEMSEETRFNVGLARALKKPLLVEGEPGCGKTTLGYAIAAETGAEVILIPCKSTTKAKDLLYRFDHLARLRDSQMKLNTSDPWKYFELGPLGKALTANEPKVLIMDEVDKADPDFADDLLHELDQLAIDVPEIGVQLAASVKPFLILTSNHKRELSGAATRRCVYEFMKFPTPEHLANIVRLHAPDVDTALLDQVVENFYEIRSLPGIQKQPSTSECIDWMKALSIMGVKELKSIEPYLGTLTKNQGDLELVLRHLKEVNKLLKELDIPRAGLTYQYEPAEAKYKRAGNSPLHESIEGRDEAGRVIVKLPDGTRYIKTVLNADEQNPDNYLNENGYISLSSLKDVYDEDGYKDEEMDDDNN